MSEREEYTPTTDEVRETYERARYYLDDTPEEGDSYRAGGGEFDRWLTAHDQALREQIARDIEARRDHFIDRAATMYEWGLPAWENAYLNGLDDAIDVARGEDQTDE